MINALWEALPRNKRSRTSEDREQEETVDYKKADSERYTADSHAGCKQRSKKAIKEHMTYCVW